MWVQTVASGYDQEGGLGIGVAEAGGATPFQPMATGKTARGGVVRLPRIEKDQQQEEIGVTM